MVIVDKRVWLLFFRTASEEEKALALGLSSAITSGFGNAVIAYSKHGKVTSFLSRLRCTI